MKKTAVDYKNEFF